jgi:two-component system nitrate/nitrite response regulator NarL
LAPPVRVLIADDEQLFGNALELILGADDRIRVVGRALDGRQAVAMARELDPDVVVMDLSMPGLTGFQAIREMVADDGGRRVVVLSGSADPDDFERARTAGACGYVTKELIADGLVPEILRAVQP